MPMPGRDAMWRKQLNAASPELRKAMNDTIRVRQSLYVLKLVGADDTRLQFYHERLTELERIERDLLEAIHPNPACAEVGTAAT